MTMTTDRITKRHHLEFIIIRECYDKSIRLATKLKFYFGVHFKSNYNVI